MLCLLYYTIRSHDTSLIVVELFVTPPTPRGACLVRPARSASTARVDSWRVARAVSTAMLCYTILCYAMLYYTMHYILYTMYNVLYTVIYSSIPYYAFRVAQAMGGGDMAHLLQDILFLGFNQDRSCLAVGLAEKESRVESMVLRGVRSCYARCIINIIIIIIIISSSSSSLLLLLVLLLL